MNNRVVIDPLNLTDETSQLLSACLSCWKKDGLFLERDKTFRFGLKLVKFTNSILTRKKFDNVWHYDVLANHASSQHKTAEFFDVIAVLKDSGNPQGQPPFLVEIKSKRVYQMHFGDAWNEFALMQRCSYLRVRGLFSGMPARISRRKFPGKLLHEVLNQERAGLALTIDQRYRLTLALLYAVKEQVHNKNICHKGIKPDHIYYDEESGKVYVTGFGISRLLNDESDNRSRGSPVFSAPEEFISTRTNKPITAVEFDAYVSMKSNSTLESDIYSLARVIGLVWRDVDPLFTSALGFDALIKLRSDADWVPKFKLFHNLVDVPLEAKRKIKYQLESMANTNKSRRPNLQACIHFFQNQYLDYKLQASPYDAHLAISAAYSTALQLRLATNLIEKRSNLCEEIRDVASTLKFNFNLSSARFLHVLGWKFNKFYHLLVQEWRNLLLTLNIDESLPLNLVLDQVVLFASVDLLQRELLEHISVLPEDILAINEFLAVSGLMCFSRIVSKEDLAARVTQTFSLFQSALAHVRRMYDEAVLADHSLIANELGHLLKVINSANVTMENIIDHIAHIDRKLQSIFPPLDIAAVTR